MKIITIEGRQYKVLPTVPGTEQGCTACAFYPKPGCEDAPCLPSSNNGVDSYFVEAAQPARHIASGWVDPDGTRHLNWADGNAWIATNYELYSRFCEEANKLRAQGRKRYSARTIGEFLRHETALRDVGDTFKLNNNRIPLMARQYMVDYNCAGFFETRGHHGA